MLAPPNIARQRIPRRIHIIGETMRSPTSRAGVAAVPSAVLLQMIFVIHVKNNLFTVNESGSFRVVFRVIWVVISG